MDLPSLSRLRSGAVDVNKITLHHKQTIADLIISGEVSCNDVIEKYGLKKTQVYKWCKLRKEGKLNYSSKGRPPTISNEGMQNITEIVKKSIREQKGFGPMELTKRIQIIANTESAAIGQLNKSIARSTMFKIKSSMLRLWYLIVIQLQD